MPINSADKRRSVDDILSSVGSGFNDMWNATIAADDDLKPIPNGTYRAVISDGRVQESSKGTSSYRIEFSIVEGEHTNRKVWHHCWLTRNALAMSKRDLAKIGIHTPDQLRQPPPSGLICEVKVALLTSSAPDGVPRNEVRGFKVIADASLSVDSDDDTTADAEESGDPTFDPTAF